MSFTNTFRRVNWCRTMLTCHSQTLSEGSIGVVRCSHVIHKHFQKGQLVSYDAHMSFTNTFRRVNWCRTMLACHSQTLSEGSIGVVRCSHVIHKHFQKGQLVSYDARMSFTNTFRRVNWCRTMLA